MTAKSETRFIFTLILSVAGIWVLFYFPYIKQGILGIDTAAYIVGAQKILSGGLLYHDFIDNKPPLIFFLFALILKIFGKDNYIALNGITLCALIGISTCLSLILRQLKISKPQCVIVVVCHVILHNVLLSHSAVEPNTEIFMTLFGLLGIYLSLKGVFADKWFLIFGSGVVLGVAAGFKQPAFLICPVAVMCMLLYSGYKRILLILKQSLCLVSGFLTVWLVLWIYFLCNGIGSRLWFICFGFGFLYGGTMSVPVVFLRYGMLLARFIQEYPLWFGLYFCGLLSSGYLMFRKTVPTGYRKIIGIVFVWHLLDTVSTMLGGLFLIHYFVQWMPSFVVITCIPLFLLFDIIPKLRVKKICVLSLTAYLCIVGVLMGVKERIGGVVRYTPPWTEYKHHAGYSAQYGEAFYQFPASIPINWFETITELVDYTQNYVQSDQTILIWGFKPELYLMCKRQPATRFIHTGMITGNFLFMENIYQNSSKKGKEVRTQLQHMLFDDLRAQTPELVIAEDTLRTEYAHVFWKYIEVYFTRVYLNPQLPYEVYIKKKDM